MKNSGDCRLNVDAIENQTGPIELVQQEEVTPNIQASTNHDPTDKFTSFEELCLVTDSQLLDNLKAQNDEEHAKYQKWTKIQRVPEVMQRNEEFKYYFKPMELSVGPLHCKDSKLFKAELKLKLAARFIKDSAARRKVYLQRLEIMWKLLTSYDEGEIKTYSEDILARLFFLDGCAVLQFILNYINRSLNEFNINNGQADLIRQDLFLFENQIPLQVLQLLMEKNVGKSGLKNDLAEFLLTNNVVEFSGHYSYSASKLYLSGLLNHDECNVAHLLIMNSTRSTHNEFS